MTRAAELRTRFRLLHHEPPDEPTPGILVMPNPFDVGSARILAALGVQALATTSAGHAGTLGRLDQHVTRDELLAHVEVMTAAVDVPFSVDSEDGLADSADGVNETARLLAATDAAGFSIEDYDPRAASIRSVDDAADRIAAAKEGGGDLVLTARAENHLYDVTDLDDTIRRLGRYVEAGADVVYAPGVVAPADIRRLVTETGAPVNVLALPSAPTIPDLAALGVARVSVGSLVAWAAYGAVVDAARELLGAGTHAYTARALRADLRTSAFT